MLPGDIEEDQALQLQILHFRGQICAVTLKKRRKWYKLNMSAKQTNSQQKKGLGTLSLSAKAQEEEMQTNKHAKTET